MCSLKQESGIPAFNPLGVFLFGKIELIFQRETTDFGDLRDDIIGTIKKLWAFGNVANTVADMSGKLIAMMS